MSKKRVGVLRGGPSAEYEVSLGSGKTVLDTLVSDELKNRFEVLDIVIDKNGVWHFQGVPIKPENIFKRVDVIFNALHGTYGEDGSIQKLLDDSGVLYTGSTTLASALGMNKILSKKIFNDYGLKTPLHTSVRKVANFHNEAVKIFKTFPMPAVVKPNNSGSSVGVSIARNLAQLEAGMIEAAKYSDVILIEEYIAGKEATCGVVDNFRGKDIYTLLPNEIAKSSDSEFYDYKAKYLTNEPIVICPGNFKEAEKKIIQEMAEKAHRALGLRHYSRSDFIIHPKRGIYILEVNTLPGLTSHSHLPKSMAAIGCPLPQFFEHLIDLALAGK